MKTEPVNHITVGAREKEFVDSLRRYPQEPQRIIMKRIVDMAYTNIDLRNEEMELLDRCKAIINLLAGKTGFDATDLNNDITTLVNKLSLRPVRPTVPYNLLNYVKTN